jgi:hypothetical protein
MLFSNVVFYLSFATTHLLPGLGDVRHPLFAGELLDALRVQHLLAETPIIISSVPDPDQTDPHVFGPPGSGSGSISQRYGSRSGSGPFYHQAKIVRKTLIPFVL